METVELQSSLQGKMLIAQPVAQSTFFGQSVVLVCEHNSRGAWGLVVNNPSTTTGVKDIAATMNIDYLGTESAYIGGPVSTDSIHIIHTPDIVEHNTWWINNMLCVTSSVHLLQKIAYGKGPKNWRLTVGMSTWQGGQLEGEQSGEPPWTPQHRWLTTSIPHDILKKPVKSLWKEATAVAINNSVNNFF